jgi:hypothetical protein
MSDVSMEELRGVHATLRNRSSYYFIGALCMWPSVAIGVLVSASTFFVGINAVNAVMYMVFLFLIPVIGNGIQGWPVLKKVLLGSGIGDAVSGPLKADYELVTVDGSGRVLSSDGGAESIWLNFFSRIGVFFVMYMISPFVVMIHIIYLSVKGIKLNAKAKVISDIKPSIKFLVLRNVITAVAPLVVFAVIGVVALGKVKANEKQIAAFAQQLTAGQTVIVTKNAGQIYDLAQGGWTGVYGTKIFKNPVNSNDSDAVVKYVKEGDILTSTGKVEETQWGFFLPVEHEGDKGFIQVEYIGQKK